MHSAPSVTYPVGRSRFAAGLLLLTWLLGGVAIALWGLQTQAPGWRLAAGALCWVTAGALAGAHWWRSPSGTLTWNGADWSWSGRADAGVLEVCLDLQRSMLVRHVASGESQWFWLERASQPQRWDDVRRAVYSRPAAGAADAPAAAAKP
jgi:toxin CptA